jgi:hypothetical protein
MLDLEIHFIELDLDSADHFSTKRQIRTKFALLISLNQDQTITSIETETERNRGERDRELINYLHEKLDFLETQAGIESSVSSPCLVVALRRNKEMSWGVVPMVTKSFKISPTTEQNCERSNERQKRVMQLCLTLNP